ncbi:MAG: ribonuclease T2 family protein [Rubricella sp.]
MRMALVALVLWAGAARADIAGEFDYYLLAMSWSPSWCAAEGDVRGAEQCDPAADTGWTLHGLWPQYEEGYPEWCARTVRDPSRAETGAMADIMGSAGLAWYQWRKHGRCSGLTAEAYFSAARAAFEAVERPAILRRVEAELRLRPSVIEEAFLEANPDWEADMLTITCRDGRIAEARLCLTRDLEPRVCAPDVRRDCSRTAAFPPIR